MKTFKQFITEVSDEFEHYKTHASKYIFHANRAAKMEKEGDGWNGHEDTIKAQHAATEVAKKHGLPVRYHMENTVKHKDDVEKSWHSRPE